MRIIECDQCGKQSKEAHPKGWTHVSLSRDDKDGYANGEMDYCDHCSKDQFTVKTESQKTTSPALPPEASNKRRIIVPKSIDDEDERIREQVYRRKN